MEHQLNQGGLLSMCITCIPLWVWRFCTIRHLWASCEIRRSRLHLDFFRLLN